MSSASQASESKGKLPVIASATSTETPHREWMQKYPSAFKILASATSTETPHREWMQKYPSAFKILERLSGNSNGLPIVVFLDYDGTLAKIVNNPDETYMTVQMDKTVRKVAKTFPTAMVSGRARNKVKEFVKLEGISYAGSHGRDILIPAHLRADGGKEYLLHQVVNVADKQEIRKVLAFLVKEVENTKNARVEDNNLSLSLHYREVLLQDHNKVEQLAKSVPLRYPGFRGDSGNMVWEIKPSGSWNKGNASDFILKHIGLHGKSIPTFIGDDTTDEPGFVVVNHLKGYSIVVSKVPKQTNACHSLVNPKEVQAFLSDLTVGR